MEFVVVTVHGNLTKRNGTSTLISTEKGIKQSDN